MSLDNTVFRVSFSLVTIFGVLSNALVCLVILLNRQMRTTMNYLLLNLAISDTVLLMFFGPTILLNLSSNDLLIDDTKCIVFSGEDVGWVCKYLSTYLHILITLDHCLAVKTPLKIKTNFIVRKQRLIVAVCWVIAISFQTIAVLIKYIFGCPATSKPTAVVQVRLYYWSCFVFNGVLPMIAITTSCLVSVHSLYFKKNLTARLKKDKLIARLRLRNAIKVVIFLGFSYIIAGIPELIWYIFLADPTTSKSSLGITFVAFVTMAMLGSSVTPLISSFFLKRFRYFTKKLFRDCHGLSAAKKEKRREKKNIRIWCCKKKNLNWEQDRRNTNDRRTNARTDRKKAQPMDGQSNESKSDGRTNDERTSRTSEKTLTL